MVLCPVDYRAEVHFTAIFALQNGKISRLQGGGSPTHAPLKFHPCMLTVVVVVIMIMMMMVLIGNLLM